MFRKVPFPSFAWTQMHRPICLLFPLSELKPVSVLTFITVSHLTCELFFAATFAVLRPTMSVSELSWQWRCTDVLSELVSRSLFAEICCGVAPPRS
jgi:hypothetical protein